MYTKACACLHYLPELPLANNPIELLPFGLLCAYVRVNTEAERMIFNQAPKLLLLLIIRVKQGVRFTCLQSAQEGLNKVDIGRSHLITSSFRLQISKCCN